MSHTVFWFRDILAGTTNKSVLIGHVEASGGFSSRYSVSIGSTIILTAEENDTIIHDFETRAEARRFLESIAKRSGYLIVTRKIGLNMLKNNVQ